MEQWRRFSYWFPALKKKIHPVIGGPESGGTGCPLQKLLHTNMASTIPATFGGMARKPRLLDAQSVLDGPLGGHGISVGIQKTNHLATLKTHRTPEKLCSVHQKNVATSNKKTHLNITPPKGTSLKIHRSFLIFATQAMRFRC